MRHTVLQGGSMDFTDAIRAHRAWKDRLRVAMAKRESLDLSKIEMDCHCELGQWLHTECKSAYGHLPEYVDCLAAHADFHREIAKAASLINAGQFMAADRLLNAGTPFAYASESLSKKLVLLVGKIRELIGSQESTMIDSQVLLEAADKLRAAAAPSTD